MNDIDTTQLLTQLRTMAAQSQGLSPPTTGAASTDFSGLLKNAVNQVNETQQTASKLASAFETGNSKADLSEVMVALQKASISFQAMTQVRNKLVSAYQDIMNMQV
ncbi:MAG: flagellar hook-basal body complex protein FliE [Gammaproteobacteria bacterium]|nr:flagellar hook-basal body complex protein FliE [Gammaproteobacteria bacterium]